MRPVVRLGAGAAIVAVLLASSHGAAAFGSYVKLTHYAGRASETFAFTYTLNRLAGDPVCPAKTAVALTWDGIALGSVPMHCETLSAQGVVTPPSAANGVGRHQFCIENAGGGLPELCYTYTVLPEPGQCDPTGNTSPPCVVGTPAATFEPDCIPNTRQSSPPCVTVTPIPVGCDTTGLGPSPPCATTPIPTPAEATALPTETPARTVPTSTPAVAATPAPTKTPTATSTRTSACAGPASPAASACPTSTPASGSGDGGGVQVRWGAVAIAAGVIGATGGAAAGAWLLLKRT